MEDERIYTTKHLGAVKLKIGQTVVLNKFYDRDKKEIENVEAVIIEFTDFDEQAYGTFRVKTVNKFTKVNTDFKTGVPSFTEDYIEMPCNIGAITKDSFIKC